MSESKNQVKKPLEFLLETRVGRMEPVNIYPISDSELEILARGSPNSIYLNFS